MKLRNNKEFYCLERRDMNQNNLGPVYISLILLSIVNVTIIFDLVNTSYKIQGLEIEQRYLKEKIVKLETFSHTH